MTIDENDYKTAGFTELGEFTILEELYMVRTKLFIEAGLTRDIDQF